MLVQQAVYQLHHPQLTSLLYFFLKVYNLASRYFEHIIINDSIRVSQGASLRVENGCNGTTDKSQAIYTFLPCHCGHFFRTF